MTQEQSIQLLNITKILNKTSLVRIYQANRDGFDSSYLYSKCVNKLNTLIVVKTNSSIFGGYTQAGWSLNGYQSDSFAFLFSLVNAYNYPVRLNVTEVENAIFSNVGWFGRKDLSISYSTSKFEAYGSSQLGYSYQIPSIFNSDSSLLAGTKNFQIEEIEVYTLEDRNYK